MPTNEIYKFLKDNNLTQKDEASFLKEYSDSAKAKELYGFMQENGLTSKDFNSFYDTYLKKKDGGIPVTTISEDVLKTGFVPQSSVPSSGTISPLEIPRPQGQSEKVRIPAPTKKPKTIDEAVQADKFRNESRLAGMYNTALNSVSKAVGGFTNLMNMAQDMVSGVYGVERGIQAATGYNPSQEKQRKTAEAITKFIDKGRSSASTKEGEQYRISKFDVTNGIGMEDLKALPEIVAQLGTDISLAIHTGGASFAAQGYQRGLDEIDALPNADKIGEGTRQFVGLSYGIIDGVLEKFALDKILKNSGATKKIRSQVLKEVTDNLVKSGEKKVTKETVQKLVTESTNKIANKLKNAGLTALKGAGIEGGTEALQSGLSAGVKYAANKLEGKEIFDEYELQESTKKDLLNSLVLGGVFGGALGGISGAATNLDNYIKTKVGEAQNEADIQTIIDEVAFKTQSGEISEAEAQEILPKVEQYKEIAKTIPAEVPAQNKGEVIAAIAERQEMEQTLAEKQKEVESTDPAFRKEKEQELNLLAELIEDKNNEIKELASQPIQPEEQITTEEQFKEPLVETVEDKTGLILYHGTPHSFEKFDISKLGTGEGQQAFGHGLYFTNKKSIAEGYANNLSSKKKFWEALMDGNEISLTKEDFDFINSELDSLGFDGSRAEMENLGNVKVDGKDEYSPSVLEALAVLFGKNAKSVLKEDYGLSDSEVERMIQIKKKISDPQLYTISLHKGKSASEYDYLDWHGALSDKQKKKIGDVSGNSGEEVYKNLSKKLGGDKAASDYLLSKGIDGIVYKSERGTGGADGKGRNYVVFDEKSIVIEDINGEKISTNLEESQVIPLQEQQKSQDITLQKEENEFKSSKEREKHNLLKNILEKAQIKNILKVSHKNNSHYWTIDGEYYRVADHTKPKGSFGEESYRGTIGENDFRSYDEFYDFLKNKIDLSDKSELEKKYKDVAVNYIIKIDENTFKQPDGSLFSSMEAALNNMWRLKKELPNGYDIKIKPQEKVEPPVQVKEEVVAEAPVSETKQAEERRIKSSFERNTEALINPQTGLSATVSKIVEKAKPYRDAYMKRKGISMEQYQKLSESDKAKIDEDWRNSQEFKELQNDTEKTITDDKPINSGNKIGEDVIDEENKYAREKQSISNVKSEPTKSIKDKFKDIADINLSDNPEVVKKREVTKYLKDNPEIADVVKNFEKVTEYLKSEKELKVVCD